MLIKDPFEPLLFIRHFCKQKVFTNNFLFGIVILKKWRKISMKSIDSEREFFTLLLDMLAQQLGPTSEIVLHDFSKEFASTIVDIRNGHVTGRSVGGASSNLGLEVLKGTVNDGNRYNYCTRLKDGKVLRSSSLFLRDENDRVYGCLCINTDISETLRMEDFLRQYNRFDVSEPVEPEIFVNDVNQLLEHLLQEGQKKLGKPACIMDRQEKIEFLRYLDNKGAFLITKSGERVQEFLGISKYTLYNYLDLIRNG